jgi:isocitrate dehydrogenase kinase/phosphatase
MTSIIRGLASYMFDVNKQECAKEAITVEISDIMADHIDLEINIELENGPIKANIVLFMQYGIQEKAYSDHFTDADFFTYTIENCDDKYIIQCGQKGIIQLQLSTKLYTEMWQKIKDKTSQALESK